MNSDNFMHWMEHKCWPAFQKQHPGKKMVVVMDNAAHHHKREMGSFTGASKKKLIEICKKHWLTHLDLPLTAERQWAIENDEEGECSHVEVHDDFCSSHGRRR